MLSELLNLDDITPKYREHLKQKIEESSPMDYRQVVRSKPDSTGVGIS